MESALSVQNIEVGGWLIIREREGAYNRLYVFVYRWIGLQLGEGAGGWGWSEAAGYGFELLYNVTCNQSTSSPV